MIRYLISCILFSVLSCLSQGASYCLSFGPGCNSYVTVPYSPDFDFQGPFTIECWFTVDKVFKNDHIPLISNFAPDPTSGIGWQIGLFKPESANLPTHIIAAYYDDIEALEAPFDPMMGKWYHLAFTYDGAVVRLFLNGNLAQRVSCTLKSHQSQQRLTIGGQSGDWWNRNLNGMIDEVRISSNCRYSEDFMPRDLFDLNNETIALWHFDEGKGDIVYDEGPGQHHGKIHGAKWVKLSDGESNQFQHLPSPIKAQRNYLIIAFTALLFLFGVTLAYLIRKCKTVPAVATSQNNHQKQTASWVFLAQRMTHQIKTPLSTILMSLERIQQEYQKRLKPEESQRADNYVEGATQEIKRLIDSSRAFMQFLKMEQPAFEIVEVSRFLDQFLRSYKLRISPEVTLETDFQPGFNVRMDTNLMNVVMENLLDNSLKAIDGGGILRISAYSAEELSPEGEQVNGKVIIEVEDTGRGMSPQLIEKVFQPYSTGTPESTGLGLFVVRRIIEDHQGKIGIKSREGIGTKVTMEFNSVTLEGQHG
jgi:signal transduction histidine kinase